MKKRSKRKISFIVVLLSLLMLKLSAQSKLLENNTISPRNLNWRAQIFDKSSTAPSEPLHLQNFFSTHILAINDDNRSELHVLSGDYYVHHFGYVCDKEWKFEKMAHV